MAWPTPPNAGDLIVDTLLDDIIAALALWGGNVNAGNHNLSNVATLSATTISASGAISGASATLSTSLDVTPAFETAFGTIAIKPQNPGAGEGGELQLKDPTGSGAIVIDNNTQNLRVIVGGSVRWQITSAGVISAYLGGSLKTLSLSGSNVIAT